MDTAVLLELPATAARRRSIGGVELTARSWWSLWVSLALVTAVGAGFAAHRWPAQSDWSTPDSLFYESNLLRIQGSEKSQALHQVFAGPLASSLRRHEAGLPLERRKVTNPAWIAYSYPFYERRWIPPLIAAAIEPRFGSKALAVVSLLGYVLSGPLLLLFLLQRFRVIESLVATLACQFLFPFRYWSGFPLTDSFGISLEVASLLCGLVVLRRGLRWLPAWILVLAVLGFTRDAGVIAVLGSLVLAARTRTRHATWLAGTGIAALLPAPLIFHVPWRDQLAYALNGFRIPPTTSWSFILDRYPSAAWRLLERDASYLWHHLLTGALVTSGLVLVAFLARSRDERDLFLVGAGIASLFYLLVLPNYTAFRLELILVPFVALGLATGLSRVAARTVRPA